jgi:hypothetical protein
MDPIDPWRRHEVPRVDASQWSPEDARLGLREIARIRAGLDAAQAALVGVVKRSSGRDTRAALVRSTGMSSGEARAAERVADVAERVLGAANALAEGVVSSGHLAALGPVDDARAAADLLVHAAGGESVDDFTTRVRRHQLEVDGAGVAERQRRARTLSFFRGEDGGIGVRALFTALDGARVRAAIERACDRAWRADHPDRAPVLGGHEAEPRDRRLSDTLVGLVCADQGVECGGADGSRVGVVVVLDEARMEAHMAGGDPVGVDEVAALVQNARTDVYAAVRSMSGAIIRFGRSRRFASAIQKLALIARDGGTCSALGCTVPWYRCDVDHQVDWAAGGPTDVENLVLLCRYGHHTHRHEPDPGGDVRDAGDGQWQRAGPGGAAA